MHRLLGDVDTPSGGARNPFGASDNVVRLGFITWSRESSKYSGLDTELTLTLSTLHLYCHRPTVAALMAFGADMADIGTVLARQTQASAQVCGQTGLSCWHAAGAVMPTYSSLQALC